MSARLVICRLYPAFGTKSARWVGTVGISREAHSEAPGRPRLDPAGPGRPRRGLARGAVPHRVRHLGAGGAHGGPAGGRLRPRAPRPGGRLHLPERSEEHTSELQSLMRNSYAVFCLKKKITKRST